MGPLMNRWARPPTGRPTDGPIDGSMGPPTDRWTDRGAGPTDQPTSQPPNQPILQNCWCENKPFSKHPEKTVNGEGSLNRWNKPSVTASTGGNAMPWQFGSQMKNGAMFGLDLAQSSGAGGDHEALLILFPATISGAPCRPERHWGPGPPRGFVSSVPPAHASTYTTPPQGPSAELGKSMFLIEFRQIMP